MKKLLLLAFMITIGAATAALGQYDARTAPIILKPSHDLTESDHFRLGKAFGRMNKYQAKATPPEVFKRPPAPERLHGANGFNLINVSNANSAQSETWIAINPTDPNNIIATANDNRYMSPYNGGYAMAAFYSTDGGQNWYQSKTPKNQNVWIDLHEGNPWAATIFDPAIAFDHNGYAYYSYGFTLTQNEPADDNGVFVCRSEDGGASWGEEPYFVELSTGSNIPFNDRFTIAADYYEGSPYQGNLYCSWQRFIKDQAIVLGISGDYGESWVLTEVYDDGGSTQSPVPIVGPDGVMYVVWQQRNSATTEAIIAKSTDGGSVFSPPITAQTVYTIGDIHSVSGRRVLSEKQQMRCSSYPAAAVDVSNSPRRGTIYIVQSGKDDKGNYGLYLAKSTTEGGTWSSNIRIDDAERRNDIFFPAISVDPVTGIISIFYYSSQNDPNNVGVDGYLAISYDGENFQNFRITPETWYIDRVNKVLKQPGGPEPDNGNYYYGDYTHIASYNGKIFPLFWMPSPLNGDFYSLELWTADISNAPKAPEIFSARASGDNFENITLTWKDPVENLLGGALEEFNVIVFRDGEEIAQVDKGVMFYEDTGLESGREYQYMIRVRDATGAESSDAYASAIAGGSQTPLAPTHFAPKPVDDGILLTWVNPAKHIDGTDFYDFSKIVVEMDGSIYKEITEGIKAGEASSLLIDDVEIGSFHMVKIWAVGERGGEETLSEETVEILAYAGAPFNGLDENFDEDETNSPIHFGDGWAITDAMSKSAPNCVTDSPDGDYDRKMDNKLTFAPFVVNDPDTALYFAYIALIEAKFDYGSVEISGDFGATWESLTWLDENSSPGFGEDPPVWDERRLSISKYVGDTVYVRFRLYSNLVKNQDGWYVDDVRNEAGPLSSVEDAQKAFVEFEAYPNPTDGLVSIKSNADIAGSTVAVYDAMGSQLIAPKRIYSENFAEFSLDLSDFANGIYYLRITSTSGVKTIPVVVRR